MTKRAASSPPNLDSLVQQTLASLEQMSTRKDHDNLKRFGITAEQAFGVSMANIQRLAKRLGRDHNLAAALWETGWYEARLLTSFVDDPACVTSGQMDRWCRDFDNWGICDTVCFFLFDRTPFAWDKVTKWSNARPEFVKRAAFALLASLAGHDKTASDDQFLQSLVLIERAADRRPEFREEGGELGAAAHRRTERGAQRGEHRTLTPPVGVIRALCALDWDGGLARFQAPGRSSAVGPYEPGTGTFNSRK